MVRWLLQQLNLSFKTFTQRNYQVRVALPENLTKTSEKVLQNVLLFYCCETNCHKYSNLKQHTLVISHCPWLRSPAQLGGLCSPFHKAVIREPAGLWAHKMVSWGRICFWVPSGYRQNSSSYRCGAEVPIFLLCFPQFPDTWPSP